MVLECFMGVQRQQQSGHLKVLVTDISLTEDAIVREIVMLNIARIANAVTITLYSRVTM